tara:strand:+ start:2627 stop:2809 length:183 start_codon:yes stop_codon:yes gene_type:complete
MKIRIPDLDPEWMILMINRHNTNPTMGRKFERSKDLPEALMCLVKKAKPTEIHSIAKHDQ